MKKLDTYIDIDAPLSEVWRSLTDLSAYQFWNPFIRRVDGTCCVEEVVLIHMRIAGKSSHQYRVKFTGVDKQRSLRWLGHFHLPGLIDGDHAFDLGVLENGNVRVRQHENFSGLLVPLVWKGFILKHLLPSFEQLNENLKAWCEKRPLPIPVQ